MSDNDEEMAMAQRAMQLSSGAGARSERERDRALLRAAAAGDDAAVRDIFRRHVDRLHRHVARILGGDDPDVEDVVQQVFLAALDGAERFDGRSSLSTWLFGIATRRALDAARSRWRRRRWSRLAEHVGLGVPAAAPDRSVHPAADAAHYLARLSPEQRVVFLMHDVEGYTFAEISGVTGVGISTLHGRLTAARRRLDELARELGDD
ncbi:MAG: RNA polymerase sigma factor [Myxococcales bacterium]|nr:RNA polymerase sigma factor [Myxococcales bacterium]